MKKKTPLNKSSSAAPHWLLIDLSNSRTKIAFATPSRIFSKIEILPTAALTPRAIQQIIADKKITRAIISSVVPKAAFILKKTFKAAKIPTLFIDGSMDLGLKFRYPSPSSLGADRLANMAGALSLYKPPMIVADFGTAITLDAIDRNGTFLGGIIAPGLTTSAKALHLTAALVPMVKLTKISHALGKNTISSLQSGLILSAQGLVCEAITRLTQENFSNKSPTVIATGGDAQLIGSNNSLFDHINPLLTLTGLHSIGFRMK